MVVTSEFRMNAGERGSFCAIGPAGYFGHRIEKWGLVRLPEGIVVVQGPLHLDGSLLNCKNRALA